MADLRKCRVTGSVTGTAFEGGAQLVAGQMVDLDQPIGGGQTLRAYVDDAWFEPAASSVTKSSRRPTAAKDTGEADGD